MSELRDKISDALNKADSDGHKDWDADNQGINNVIDAVIAALPHYSTSESETDARAWDRGYNSAIDEIRRTLKRAKNV